MICNNCGLDIQNPGKFCPHCGAPLPHTHEDVPHVHEDMPPVQDTPVQSYTPPVQNTPVQSYTPPVQDTPVQSYTPPVQDTPVQSYTPPVQGTPVQSTPPAQDTPVQSYTPPIQDAPVQSYTPPVQNTPVQSYTPPVQDAPVQSYTPPARPVPLQPNQPVVYQQRGTPQPYIQPGIPIAVTPPKKKRGGLVVAILGLLALLGGSAALLLSGAPKLPDVSYSYLRQAPEPEISITSEDTIFPALYRSLDALATFVGTSEAERDVLIHVEIPGFTQPYEQKTRLSPQITKLNIRPPLLTGSLDLASGKEAQLKLSVTDMDTGKLLLQDSRAIRIMSKYDVIWWSEELRHSNTDNILSFLSPESEGILQLKRDAASYLSYITDGSVNSFVGYQDYGIFDNPSDNTWLQAVALQGAMSDIANIKYVNTVFSISEGVQQRVLMPDDVIKNRSGLCIETALVMASALQSAGMHAMLLFPPGHAQVAVECWPGWGEYFLIETTVLPMPQNSNAYNYVVSYMDQAQWQGYIDGTGKNSLGPVYVLDCDLAQKLQILPLSN